MFKQYDVIARILPSGLVDNVITVFDPEWMIPPDGGINVLWDATKKMPAYYKDGSFYELPEPPSPHHIFDPVSEGWIDPRSPEDISADLALRKMQSAQTINTAAGQARQRFITDLPGQEMIYKAKLDEAQRYVSGPEPANLDGFPLIAAEVGITAQNAYQIAVIWLWMAEVWIRAAAQIEAIRLSGIAAVQSAQDIEGVRAAEETATSALGAIQP